MSRCPYLNKAPVELLENDTLSLLLACYRHRGEYQTQALMGEWSGLSQQRVSDILRSPDDTWNGGESSMLYRVATKYGIAFRLYSGRKGLLIDVYDIRGRSVSYDGFTLPSDVDRLNYSLVTDR